MIKAIDIFIISGLIIFTALATFHVTYWAQSYFLWDKAKDLLLMYGLWQFTRKQYGNYLLPMVWFLLIRLLWEPVSLFTGLAINNSYAVGCLFLLYSIYVFIKAFPRARNN